MKDNSKKRAKKVECRTYLQSLTCTKYVCPACNTVNGNIGFNKLITRMRCAYCNQELILGKVTE